MDKPILAVVAVAALVAALVWGRSAQRFQRVWQRIERELGEEADATVLARSAYRKELHTVTLYAVIAVGDDSAALGMGIGAAGLGAVMIPVVALGGWSARRGGGARGLPDARWRGWALYAVAMIDAGLLIALATKDADVPPLLVGLGGLFGAVSAAVFAFDAYESAWQTRWMAGAPRPTLLVGRDAAAVSLTWRF